jgi:hypothetical protein
MKKSRFTQVQIAYALRLAEGGTLQDQRASIVSPGVAATLGVGACTGCTASKACSCA